MRGSREEEQRIDLLALLEFRNEAVRQCLAGALIHAQVMSLVDDDQIPRIGIEKSLASAATIVPQCVEGCDNH